MEMAKLKISDINNEGLEDLIPQFFQKNAEAKSIRKDADKLKEKAKEKMAELNMVEYEVGDLVATINHQDRSSLNPDKLLEKMKKLGHTKVIKTVEKVDETAVEDLIYKGELKPEDIADCLESKIVKVFTVKKMKKSKKKGGKLDE